MARHRPISIGTVLSACPLPSEPWTMAFSKGWKKKFFYNKKTGESFFTLPTESIAPFQ